MFQELRNKPKHVRERIAFVGTIVLTGIIAGAWAVTLPMRFASESDGGAVTRVPGAFSRVWTDLTTRVGDTISEVRGSGTVSYTATSSSNEMPGTTNSTSTDIEAVWQQTLDDVRAQNATVDHASVTKVTTGNPVRIATSSTSRE